MIGLPTLDRPAAPVRDSVEYASVGRRAAAVVVDSVVLLAIGWGVAFVKGTNDGINYSVEGADAVVTFGAFVLYCIVMEAVIGATLGKLAVRIRVVGADGRRIDLASAIIRNGLRIVDGFLFYLVGAIAAWNSSKLQRLGDRVAGTIVVVRDGSPAAPAFELPEDQELGSLDAPTVTEPGHSHKGLVAAGVAAGTLLLALVAAQVGGEVQVRVGSSSGEVSALTAQEAAEQWVSRLGVPISDVLCPGGGGSSICTARLDGQGLDIRVTQLATSGRFDIQPLQSILPVPEMETMMADYVSKQAGATVTVSCGTGAFLVKAPGATFECRASFGDGTQRVITSTVKDTDGNFSFTLLVPRPQS